MRPHFLLLIAVLVGGCATQEAAVEPKEAGKESDSVAQYVERGHDQLLRRNYKLAITEFDRAIALCQYQFSDEGKQYYATRSLVETILYMTMAAEDGKDAVAVDTLCSDALYLRGYADIDLGNLDSAQSFLEKAVAMAPMNSLYLSELGHIQQLKKDWPGALETFELSVDAAEKYSPDALKSRELTRAMRGVGYIYIELGRLDEAEEMYRACLALDPNDKGALGELKYIEGLRQKGG